MKRLTLVAVAAGEAEPLYCVLSWPGDQPAAPTLPEHKAVNRCLSMVWLAAVTSVGADNAVGYEHVLLKGDAAQVVIAVDGGAIADFHLHGHGLNPLSWQEEGESLQEPPWRGHFLCLDRWGEPSAAERENGMPFHGEASRLPWQVSDGPERVSGSIRAEMGVELPLAGLAVRRSIALSQRQAIFTVREEITNTRKLGRIYTMVQHPTIAPPFLDENTVIDANGRKGFMTYRPMPNPEEPAVSWPQALKDGEPVNVRFLTNDHDPNVVSYTLDDEYGWYVAYNAARGLLLGYIWKSSDYPWLIDWRWGRGWQADRARSRVRDDGAAAPVFRDRSQGPNLRQTALRIPGCRSDRRKIVRRLPAPDSG